MSFMHPFYLGVIDLKYNKNEKAIQGSVKLFTNDLEVTLTKINRKTVDLINSKNKEETSKILFDYLSKHVKLTNNGKLTALKFIGYEIEQEAVWMYVEFSAINQPKGVNIECTLLYEQLKEQINIINLEVNNSKKVSKITNPETTINFQF